MSTKDIAVDISMERKKEIWSSIIKELDARPEERQEGELDINELAELLGLSVSHTRRKMKTLVEEGKVRKRLIRFGKTATKLVYLPLE